LELDFTSPQEHPPGTVFELLRRAWAPLWNPGLEANIRAFDTDVTDEPATVGACTFITCLDGLPVGMASYDPRQGPERGIIGWNGVVPEQQRRGFGTRQIRELLRIFRHRGFRKACVTTGQEDFFVPAQRMCEACNFLDVGRTEDDNIAYELQLS